jgi:hypothetical protein
LKALSIHNALGFGLETFHAQRLFPPNPRNTAVGKTHPNKINEMGEIQSKAVIRAA